MVLYRANLELIFELKYLEPRYKLNFHATVLVFSQLRFR